MQTILKVISERKDSYEEAELLDLLVMAKRGEGIMIKEVYWTLMEKWKD